MKRIFLVALMVALLVAMATPAFAQGQGFGPPTPCPEGQHRQGPVTIVGLPAPPFTIYWDCVARPNA